MVWYTLPILYIYPVAYYYYRVYFYMDLKLYKMSEPYRRYRKRKIHFAACKKCNFSQCPNTKI